MADVMLVQPWTYHDERVKDHDLAQEWRNGPYALVLLATQLRKHGHRVAVVDMIRDLVVMKGDVDACLASFSESIREFQPDIMGFGFYSIHYFEVRRVVRTARDTCAEIGLHPMFLGGGVHATTEPEGTMRDLGFDYAFRGEADLGILQLADGCRPETVPGVATPAAPNPGMGEKIKPLDDLPFPDWSLCDYKFYSYPSFAKLKIKQSGSLDLVMGRGCVYKCAFCAYNAISTVHFYTAEYLVEQVEYLNGEFDVDAVYFTDSTIGNNRPLVRRFCELMIERGTSERVEWYANVRVNQVNEKQLKLMWRAGCRYLLYGFESGSQRMLDLMCKRTTVEDNYKIAYLHNKLRFPYNGSMVFGYPGEREEDIQASLEFLRKTRPPSIGINWYVPLPGSPDYYELKNKGMINVDDPLEWRRIGEVNPARAYADMPEGRFRELFAEAQKLANEEIPRAIHDQWYSTVCV